MLVRLVTLKLLLIAITSLSAFSKEFVVGLQRFEQADNKQYFVFIFPLIFTELEQLTGDTYTFRYYDLAERRNAFEHGEIDLVPGLNPAWFPNAKVESLFSTPFSSVTTSFLHRDDRFFDTNKIEQFSGKKLGIVKSYHYPEIATYIESGKIETVQVADQEMLLNKLIAGELEHIVINRQFALYWLHQRKKSDFVKFGHDLSSLPISIRVQTKHSDMLPRLNKAIEKLLADGSISKIFNPLYLDKISEEIDLEKLLN